MKPAGSSNRMCKALAPCRAAALSAGARRCLPVIYLEEFASLDRTGYRWCGGLPRTGVEVSCRTEPDAQRTPVAGGGKSVWGRLGSSNWLFWTPRSSPLRGSSRETHGGLQVSTKATCRGPGRLRPSLNGRPPIGTRKARRLSALRRSPRVATENPWDEPRYRRVAGPTYPVRMSGCIT